MSLEVFNNIKSILDTKNFSNKGKNIYIDNKKNNFKKNFEFQWNKFPLTQLDSHTGLPLSKERFTKSSDWQLANLKDKIVIEIGSGAGRFTEILSNAGSYVISIEISDAIFVNYKNNKSDKIIFIKSSLYDLQFLNGLFDYVLCYGVAQHTPNIFKTYQACYDFCKIGGKISIDHYLKTYLPSPKYLWRPVTKRINPKTLIKIIKFYIPYYFPIDTFLKTKLPDKIGKIIRRCIPIPCWNYTGEKNVPQEHTKLLTWSILDTFDGLSAEYDTPLRPSELEQIVEKIGVNSFTIKEGGTGIVLNIDK